MSKRSVHPAGLMVGRTPEYLGNKIEARGMKLVIYALLASPVLIFGFGAISAMRDRTV